MEIVAIYLLGGLVSIYLTLMFIDIQTERRERAIIKSLIKEERY